MTDEKKKQTGWVVGMTIVDENKPPLKVLQKADTEETLDLHGVLALMLNNQERLLKGLL